MPELPEVETIRRHLAPHVEGRTLASARGPRPALVRGRCAAPRWSRRAARAARSSGSGGAASTWSGSCRTSVYLLMHLRMTGHAAARPGRARPPHTRVRLRRSTTATRSLFVDPRRFGTGELALGADALRRVLRRAARRRAARRRVHRRAPARARARRARADQGVPARPEADRRRRQHLRRRGAVPRPHPPAAARRTGSRASRSERAARRGRRVARGRDRRPRARRSTTSATPTARSGTFQDRSSCTCARASRARAAARRSASCAPRGAGPTSASAASRARGAGADAALPPSLGGRGEVHEAPARSAATSSW